MHCVKGVHIWSYFGAYSVRMPKNEDQNDSEYRVTHNTDTFHAVMNVIKS